MNQSFFFICLFALFFLQCEVEKSPIAYTGDTITFKGQIENASTNSITISTSFAKKEVGITNNQFLANFATQQPLLAEFKYKGNHWTTFAQPGDTIGIHFKERDFKNTFTFSEYATESRFASGLSKILKAPGLNYSTFFAQKEPQFLKAMETLKTENIAKIDQFMGSHPKGNPLFAQWLKEMVIYTVAENLELYPKNYVRITRDTAYKKGAAYLAMQQAITVERPDLIGLPAYTQYLSTKINTAANEIWGAIPIEQKKGIDFMIARLEVTKETVKDEQLQEYLDFLSLRDQILNTGVTRVYPYLAPFLEKTNNAFYKKQLHTLFGKLEHLQDGKMAPDFSYPDADGVLHSLSDYKGKYVYIDIWATWCGPCLAQQPSMAVIEDRYKDNPNIVFMGVSIDTNKKTWKRMLKSNQLKGIQLLANAGFSSDIIQKYTISGIPRFILVDKTGNLIDANALRPGSMALRQQLKELLEEEKLPF